MAGSSTVSVLVTNSIPKVLSQEKSELYQIKKRDFTKRSPHSVFLRIGVNFGRKSSKRLFAGLSEVEPDLNEDPKDRWETNGIAEVF